jgi:heptaprenyl diphosphate synthase
MSGCTDVYIEPSGLKMDFYKLNLLDITLIALILGGASGGLLFSGIGFNRGGSAAPEAWIYQGGELVVRLGLEKEGKHTLAGGKVVVETAPGRVRVLESTCAGHICVNTGWIQSPGEMIACVPNQVMIEIKSKKGPLLDAVVE